MEDLIGDGEPKDDRLFRGGAFYFQPSNVRSANRSALAPRNSSTYLGFRLARTYN